MEEGRGWRKRREEKRERVITGPIKIPVFQRRNTCDACRSIVLGEGNNLDLVLFLPELNFFYLF